MVDEVEQLVSEIVQIKNQYMAEVGCGRRAWPKAIKDRIARLDEIGIAPKVVAARTTIPYDTIILWRYSRRHGVNARLKTGFHQLKVSAGVTSETTAPIAGGRDISKSVAVTVSDIKIPFAQLTPPGRDCIRLTTPNGFIIDGLDEAKAARLVGVLSQMGGGHAS